MSATYLRNLVGRERSQAANRHLAFFLAFIAGATNAGGFMAVHRYTSHMSGTTASMADDLALGQFHLVGAGLAAIVTFTAGAASTAMLVNWARRRRLHSQYALPLVVEAALLMCFGAAGGLLNREHVAFVSLSVVLLCFAMGMQNAIITKISQADIRTTHVTGMITDVGIELGKALYVNRSPGQQPVRADWKKLGLLSALIGLFLFGGTIGALGFKRFGFVTTLPLAGLLLSLASVSVLDDLRLAPRRIAVTRARTASRGRGGDVAIGPIRRGAANRAVESSREPG